MLYLKRYYYIQSSNFFPMKSSKNFIVFRFRYVIHFRLTFVMIQVYVQIFCKQGLDITTYYISIYTYPGYYISIFFYLLKRLSLLHCITPFAPLSKTNQLFIWIYFGLFYFVLLIYLSIAQLIRLSGILQFSSIP